MAQAAQREVDEQIRQQKKVKPSLLCAVLPSPSHRVLASQISDSRKLKKMSRKQLKLIRRKTAPRQRDLMDSCGR